MLNVILLILIVPGLACLYAMILRPILRRIPQLQQFYADADGFWAKVWAICGNSLTILFHYIVGGIGIVLETLDPIAAVLGDPDFKSQVTNLLQFNPKVLGAFAIIISLITIVARLRSITKG